MRRLGTSLSVWRDLGVLSLGLVLVCRTSRLRGSHSSNLDLGDTQTPARRSSWLSRLVDRGQGSRFDGAERRLAGASMFMKSSRRSWLEGALLACGTVSVCQAASVLVTVRVWSV